MQESYASIKKEVKKFTDADWTYKRFFILLLFLLFQL